MARWRNRIYHQTVKLNIKTDIFQINTGIYQGDSLSVLWFCLNPLSGTLNNTSCGFNINNTSQKFYNLVQCLLNFSQYAFTNRTIRRSDKKLTNMSKTICTNIATTELMKKLSEN